MSLQCQGLSFQFYFPFSTLKFAHFTFALKVNLTVYIGINIL